MLRHSLSSVSEHDADWDMCAFLARLLPVCKPVSRLTSAGWGQEYSRYLNRAVGVRELRARKNDWQGSALPYAVHPLTAYGAHQRSRCAPRCRKGVAWVGNEWSPWPETKSLAMERNACPLPLSEGDRYGHLRTKANGHTLMGWWEYENCVRDRRKKPTARRGLGTDSPTVY